MFTTPYKSYFLRILFSSEGECGTSFSLAVEISQAQRRNPVVTIYTTEPIASEEEGIMRGFELGRQWVNKTLPSLSSPIAEAQTTIARSARIVAAMQSAIAKSCGTVARSEDLIHRSRNLMVPGSAHRDLAGSLAGKFLWSPLLKNRPALRPVKRGN